MDRDLTTWNSGAKDYLAVATGTDEFKEFVDDPAFIGLLGVVADKRILDIGCGDGTLVQKLRIMRSPRLRLISVSRQSTIATC